jgi:hypothetical protein
MVVNEVIENGSSFTRLEKNVNQKVFDQDNLRVVTEDNGRIVRTLSKVDWDDFDIPYAKSHVKVRQYVNENGRRAKRREGILGAHDKVEFAKIKQKDITNIQGYRVPGNTTLDKLDEIVITKRYDHPQVPGVEIIEYKIPEIDGKGPSIMIDGDPVAQGFTTGNLIEPQRPIKTVYDPAVWPDKELEAALKEAIQDVSIAEKGVFINGKRYVGRTKDGYPIEFWYRDNRVATFYFMTP